jgi:hypothetical protein
METLVTPCVCVFVIPCIFVIRTWHHYQPVHRILNYVTDEKLNNEAFSICKCKEAELSGKDGQQGCPFTSRCQHPHFFIVNETDFRFPGSCGNEDGAVGRPLNVATSQNG